MFNKAIKQSIWVSSGTSIYYDSDFSGYGTIYEDTPLTAGSKDVDVTFPSEWVGLITLELKVAGAGPSPGPALRRVMVV